MTLKEFFTVYPMNKMAVARMLKMHITTLNKLINREKTPTLKHAISLNHFTMGRVTFEEMLAAPVDYAPEMAEFMRKNKDLNKV